MQVMCVTSPKGWMRAAHIVGSGFPVVGDILTVKDHRRSSCCNGSHFVYDFEEYTLLQEFDTRCFAILPEADADEMQDNEHEAIVPTPVTEETNELLKIEKALRAYHQVYELTGCENRATEAYYQSFENPTP